MKANSSVAHPAGPFASLRYPDYRLYWFSLLVSVIGSQMQIIVVGWHVYEITGDALLLGLTGAFRAVPLIMFGLFGGAIADRVDRRRVIVVTQSSGLVFAALLGVLTTTGQVTAWWIYALTFLTTLASAFEGPARQAMIPAMVPRHHITNAVTLNVILRQTANIVGPGVGGLMLAYVGGPAAAYFFNAASFLVVVVAMFLIKAKTAPAQTRLSVLESMHEGLRFLGRSPLIISVLVLDLLATILGAYRALLPIIAKDILGVGPEGYGLLAATPSAGAVLGSTTILTRGDMRHKGWWILAATFLYGVWLALFGLSSTFWLSIALAGMLGVFDTIAETIRSAVMQLATPDELLGRVMSVGQMVFQGGPSTGYLIAGVLAAALGAPGALLVGSVACVLGTSLIAWRIPEMRHYQ